ncbi:class I SAM-dependent methyltransferase [Candidatus Woesearchaeota archaeon]|nr:class I SAM-dependent methyltransferase [Candidatus Woesearchaeota archaeon]
MQKLSAKDIARNDRMYGMIAATGNPDYWFGTHKEDNYQRLARITEFTKVPLNGTKCLDVGCGTGDFSKFLRKNGVSGYFGVDVYEPSLHFAREKYPHEKFKLIDLLEWETDEKFDYVFCSGGLSTRLDSDNYDFMESMLRKIWGLARLGIAFNFLVDNTIVRDPNIFHYSFDRVLALCRQTTKDEGRIFYRIEDGEAHVYLWRKEVVILK